MRHAERCTDGRGGTAVFGAVFPRRADHHVHIVKRMLRSAKTGAPESIARKKICMSVSSLFLVISGPAGCQYLAYIPSGSIMSLPKNEAYLVHTTSLHKIQLIVRLSEKLKHIIPKA